MQPHEISHPPGEFVTVNGARLWVEKEGVGPPLLVVAGGPGASHLYLHPWFTPFAKQFQVIYFDALGCGKSDPAPSHGEYTLERAVADIEALRQALGFKQWRVLGHSYGGVAALAYALKFPDSVQRVVLSNSVFSSAGWEQGLSNVWREVSEQFPEMADRVSALRSEGKLATAPEILRIFQPPLALYYFYDGSNAVKTVSDISNEVFYAMVGADGDFKLGAALQDFDFRAAMAKLEMPVLIVCGRYDRICTPRHSFEARKLAPNVALEVFEASGHLPFIEEPVAYLERVSAFLLG